MPDAHTALLRLIDQVPGENDETWGDKADTNFQLIENAIAGFESHDVAAADLTLTSNNGAVDQARKAMLKFTGTLAATREVIVPTSAKLYLCWDATTHSGNTLTVKTSAGTGVALTEGNVHEVFCDGTNVVAGPSRFALTDDLGNEILIGSDVASAVNEITAQNAATGNDPQLQATGDDSDIGLDLISKGNGTNKSNSNPLITQVTQQIFTADDTYTKPAGLIYAIVEVVGAGGGGGGADTDDNYRGVGGGGGGYSRELLAAAAIGATETVTIGAGGTAGTSSATPTAGGNGGTTSFGALLSATGGTGGLAATASAQGGVGGGTGSGGDINLKGGSSFTKVAAGTAHDGRGGPGAGPYGGENGGNVGEAGLDYGGGGNAGNHTGANGGVGAGGFVLVTEFKA